MTQVLTKSNEEEKVEEVEESTDESVKENE